MQQWSITRLELQAALFSTRLRAQILKKKRDIIFDEIHHWTDSVTVLHWLHSAHKRPIVFVANRVAEILETFTIDAWNHAPGVDNPADIGTRE